MAAAETASPPGIPPTALLAHLPPAAECHMEYFSRPLLFRHGARHNKKVPGGECSLRSLFEFNRNLVFGSDYILRQDCRQHCLTAKFSKNEWRHAGQIKRAGGAARFEGRLYRNLIMEIPRLVRDDL